MNENKLLNFTGLRYLFGRQLISRGFTFLLGILITRHVSPSTLGISNVQMQLWINTVMMVTRESFRRVCLRHGSTNGVRNDSFTRLMNFAWLTVPFSVFTCTLFTWLFYYFSNEEQLSQEYFVESLVLTGVASFLELLSEPVYILAQNRQLYKERMYTEFVGLLVKVLTTYFLVMFTDYGLIAFAFGQILFSITLIVGYFGYFIKTEKDVRSIFPKYLGSFENSFEPNAFKLLLGFEWQSVQKLVLQEGEKIVLTTTSSLVNQGIYSVVNNLGSLVARFLFQPLEEITFNVFSLVLGVKDENEKMKQKKMESDRLLRILIKFIILFGLIFISFGPGYSYIVLQILYTSKYSQTSAPMVLSAYCVYIFFMGLNGITEAFAHAVFDERQIKNNNFLMLILSVIYMASSYILVNAFNTVGLIAANCLNMILRIAYNGYFIFNYLSDIPPSPISTILPSKQVLLSLALSFIVTIISANQTCNADVCLHDNLVLGFFPSSCILHTAIGIILLFVTLISIYYTERQFLRDVVTIWREKKKIE